MKKIIILVLFLGMGLYFLLFQKSKSPEIVSEKKVEVTKEKIVTPSPPKFLKEEPKPLQKPYLGVDFKPIDPPAGKINIENKINPELEIAIKKQIQNPQIPEMTAEIKTQGTYIWVRENIGRFVEQILVTINSPTENGRTFNAYADAETGEIVHTIEPYEATYSTQEIDASELESSSRENNSNDSSDQPPDEEMTFPVDE